MDQTYMTTEGIFGIPLYVSATYVMLFILFGAFVERSGAGQLFMDFALALAGHTAGGPAKVAVLTSALFGTVSGSAVANVMTTGTFTIPLMKRRSEEHTSELQSLMRTSYAVFCLKKKNTNI